MSGVAGAGRTARMFMEAAASIDTGHGSCGSSYSTARIASACRSPVSPASSRTT